MHGQALDCALHPKWVDFSDNRDTLNLKEWATWGYQGSLAILSLSFVPALHWFPALRIDCMPREWSSSGLQGWQLIVDRRHFDQRREEQYHRESTSSSLLMAMPWFSPGWKFGGLTLFMDNQGPICSVTLCILVRCTSISKTGQVDYHCEPNFTDQTSADDAACKLPWCWEQSKIADGQRRIGAKDWAPAAERLEYLLCADSILFCSGSNNDTVKALCIADWNRSVLPHLHQLWKLLVIFESCNPAVDSPVVSGCWMQLKLLSVLVSRGSSRVFPSLQSTAAIIWSPSCSAAEDYRITLHFLCLWNYSILFTPIDKHFKLLLKYRMLIKSMELPNYRLWIDGLLMRSMGEFHSRRLYRY